MEIRLSVTLYYIRAKVAPHLFVCGSYVPPTRFIPDLYVPHINAPPIQLCLQQIYSCHRRLVLNIYTYQICIYRQIDARLYVKSAYIYSCKYTSNVMVFVIWICAPIAQIQDNRNQNCFYVLVGAYACIRWQPHKPPTHRNARRQSRGVPNSTLFGFCICMLHVYARVGI